MVPGLLLPTAIAGSGTGAAGRRSAPRPSGTCSGRSRGRCCGGRHPVQSSAPSVARDARVGVVAPVGRRVPGLGPERAAAVVVELGARASEEPCPFDQPHLTGGWLTSHDAAHGSEGESDGGTLAGASAGPAGQRAVGARVVPGEQLSGARLLLVTGQPGAVVGIEAKAAANAEAGRCGLHSCGR
jgi:hypothetical protein